MNNNEKYQQKLTTADEAVKLIASGDWIDYAWCAGTPQVLDEALARRYENLWDVKVRGGVLLEKPKIMQVPDTAQHFTWDSWHMSGIERKMISEGTAFYAPMRYSELPRFYRENVEPIHVAMFQVAPMDKEGYFSFGPNASHLEALCEKAEKVIVEVNPNLPYALDGKADKVHIDQVDLIVENNHSPMRQLGGGAAAEVDLAVAKLIMEEIPNGACLQLGIGGMPNAVGAMIAQSDLKDLGVHTEMYVDAFVDIANAGKITGQCRILWN